MQVRISLIVSFLINFSKVGPALLFLGGTELGIGGGLAGDELQQVRWYSYPLTYPMSVSSALRTRVGAGGGGGGIGGRLRPAAELELDGDCDSVIYLHIWQLKGGISDKSSHWLR